MTHVFLMPKGVEDITMVYNGTSDRLNDLLWDPHFDLPIVSNTLSSIEEGAFMADRNMGEIFLNFIMGKELRPYCGGDITHTRSGDNLEWEGISQSNWEIR